MKVVMLPYYHLKTVVKGTPALYAAVIKLKSLLPTRRRRDPHRLSGKGVDLCIEGYPSSGNSFALNLVRELRPGLTISSHFHSVANVKLARKHGIPTVILIRHPADAISSRVVRFNVQLEIAMLEYIDFYRMVLGSKPMPLVVPFDELVDETGDCLQRISKHTGVSLPWDNLEDITDQVLKEMEDWFKRRGVEPALPDGQREHRKDVCRRQMEGSSHWRDTLDIHDRVMERCVQEFPQLSGG